jgi:anti-anti-sigma factor
MTVSIDSAASGRRAFVCDGAEVRAQCRHLATVVTISGVVDLKNVDRVSRYSRRFILQDKPFVLDMCGVEYFAAQSVTLLRQIDEDCRMAGLEWALVASPVVSRVLRMINEDNAFSVEPTVHTALHSFADDISDRRRLLLPLLSKTA